MVRTKRKIKRTTIELTDEQYFFLKEKALAMQKQNKSHSIISIIQDLIEKDCEKWIKEKKSYEVSITDKKEEVRTIRPQGKGTG